MACTRMHENPTDCDGLRTGNVDFATEPLPPHESYLLIATGAQDMADDPNRYETGARKYPAKMSPDAADQFSQDAAGNKPPPGGMGLTRPADDFDDKTRHSEGQNPPRAVIRPDDKASPKKPGEDAKR
ncbi:hypothetical protein [Mesorhizobium sp. M0909]|uniref:hypothetical protein n=1 Tax=Mesorhizobium sp. M0909 TaxID=2957024 RepID=UPI003335990D